MNAQFDIAEHAHEGQQAAIALNQFAMYYHGTKPIDVNAITEQIGKCATEPQAMATKRRLLKEALTQLITI